MIVCFVFMNLFFSENLIGKSFGGYLAGLGLCLNKKNRTSRKKVFENNSDCKRIFAKERILLIGERTEDKFGINEVPCSNYGSSGTGSLASLVLPEIAFKKAISFTPSFLVNGNYVIHADFVLKKSGGATVCSINMEEGSAIQFGHRLSGFVLAASPSLAVNTSGSVLPASNVVFNGDSHTYLISSDGCLLPGGQYLVSVMVGADISCSFSMDVTQAADLIWSNNISPLTNLVSSAPTILLEPGQSFYVALTAVVIEPTPYWTLIQPVNNQATGSGDPVDGAGSPISGFPSAVDLS